MIRPLAVRAALASNDGVAHVSDETPDWTAESGRIMLIAGPESSMPAELRIGTVVYKVTVDADDWMRIEHSTQSKGYYGHTHHKSATIYLNPESTPDVLRLTLWHEVLHAVAETMMGSPDLRALPGAPESKDDAEEAVIRMLEHPTLVVLRDNPELVAYLTA